MERALAIAALVSRNAVPVAGLIFFGWPAVNLVVLYFLDFLLDIALVLALLMMLDPEFREIGDIKPGFRGAIRMAWLMLIVIVALGFVFGFVFGIPVFGMMVMDADFSLAKLFGDPGFRRSLAVHYLLSSWTYFQAYRYFAALRAADPKFDVSKSLKGRFNYVLMRWMAVYVAGLMLPFFPEAMVIAFCAATIYAELNPKRIQEIAEHGPSEPPQPSR